MQISSWKFKKANKSYAIFSCIGSACLTEKKEKFDLQPQVYITLYAAID